MKNYKEFYGEIFEILGDLTPLSSDCGKLCSAACCRGDDGTGMRLFPHEETCLRKKLCTDGGMLAICDGKCQRDCRPLACRIFPFFPTVTDSGEIAVKLDLRAFSVCPMVENFSQIRFDRDFLRAVRRVGRRLQKDSECHEFLRSVTAEIEELSRLLPGDFALSRRK